MMAVWLVLPPALVAEAEHGRAQEERGVGRREVVGDDDGAVAVQLTEVGLRGAHEVAQDAIADEVDVGPTLAKVLVVDVVEELLQDAQHLLLERPLGVDALLGLDPVPDAVDELRPAS
jgi:hypothetical protein